jgi:hypothetical protein
MRAVAVARKREWEKPIPRLADAWNARSGRTRYCELVMTTPSAYTAHVDYVQAGLFWATMLYMLVRFRGGRAR